jgi:hypothetical protein
VFQDEDRAALPQPLPEMRFLVQAPKDLKSTLLQLHFGKITDLKGTMTFPDAAGAEDQRRQFEQLKKLGRPIIQFGGPGGDHAALQELTRQLLGIETEVSGTDLVVRLQIDLGRLLVHLKDIRFPMQLGPIVEKEIPGVKNLQDLAQAFERYHEANGHYPPAVVCSKDGTPLFSWRVALLPYLGEEKLYAQFDREQPWNHPKNALLLAKMPQVFANPALSADTTREQTCFQLLTGPKAAFHEGRMVKKADLKDGPGQTLLLVEHQQLFPWTAPMDVSVPDDRERIEKEVLPRLGLLQGNTFRAVLFDGTIRKLKRSDVKGFMHAVNPADGVGLPDS